MRRLATLRHPATPTTGSELHRLAVRAVVRRTGRLLLVESADGDLALPGGGVEPGESLEDALRREVREETGAQTLVDYERHLGLTLVWLETAAALARLQEVAGSTWRRSPRDLVVLERLVAEGR